ncbi:hypothetical protein B0H63DRAFT_481048 [Podospora didyma]|uniref:Uncharacterized protein n=1 Tax=Podospora didyma TaxID=330526 RepID=A0AAE0N8L4_9PEZI|nr:hypothetical protein B0H63DRAFT_481048 [Podospora didyma]
MKCDVCDRSSSLCWVYRCAVQRDAIIMGDKAQGKEVSFDDLGRQFEDKMSMGKFGPDLRMEKYSLLKEMSEEDLHNYNPSQLLGILEHRDNVKETISHDPEYTASKWAGKSPPNEDMPWLPNEKYECKYTVCQYCYGKGGLDRCWLSLDGVLSGDIPPHAATGFGFSVIKERLVADASIVKNIGYRAVPMPRYHEWTLLSYSRSTSSSGRVLDIIDEHLGMAANAASDDGTQGAGRFSHLNTSQEADDIVIRPPWTPPPTPEPRYWFEDGYMNDPVATDASLEVPTYTGRSPTSLKTNPLCRERAFWTIPSLGMVTAKLKDYTAHGVSVEDRRIPYLPEEMYDVGLFLPFNPEVHARACGKTLPGADVKEALFFSEHKTAIEEKESEAGIFSDDPLDAVDGVALTEEAIESGTANVVDEKEIWDD